MQMLAAANGGVFSEQPNRNAGLGYVYIHKLCLLSMLTTNTI